MCTVSGRLQDSHLRRSLGTRQVRAAGLQGGRQDGLFVVFNCLLVAGWKFPSHPPKGLQECGVPFVGFCLFCFDFLGSPLIKGRFNHYRVWMGSR